MVGRRRSRIEGQSIKCVPYPCEDAKDDAYSQLVEASLRTLERKRREEKTRALKSRIEHATELTKRVVKGCRGTLFI